MAIIPESQFVGKITPSSSEYPYGKARNITTPGDGTGTPFIAALVNDLFGFQQALLEEGGVTPSGNPDTATDSQYLDGLKAIFADRVIRVTSIAAMEAYSAPVGYVFSLNAGGRSGVFDVIAGDFSTELAADTANGIYVALADDLTAATKVAKRRYNTGEVYPQWFNILGDDSTDQGPAIQSMQDLLGAGIHYFYNEGVFLINTPVAMNDGAVTVSGVPLQPFIGAFGANSPQEIGSGTWFKTTNTSAQTIVVQPTSRGVTFENIGLIQPQDDPGVGWAPTVYEFFISVLADGSKFDNVIFFPVYRGISFGVTGSAMGRAIINDLKGETVFTGIDLIFSADVVKLHNIHLYPYWSAYNANVRSYTRANASGIVSRRSDNTLASNIFAFGLFRGIELQSSADGPTSKFKLINADLDDCTIGFDVTGNNCTYQISNFSSQGGTNGLKITGNNNIGQVQNIETTLVNANAVRVEGTGNLLSINGIKFDRWDEDGSGFPALEVLTGNTLSVDDINPIFLNGTNYYGGAGTIKALIDYGYNTVTVNGSGQATIAIDGNYAPTMVIANIISSSGSQITVQPRNLSETGFGVTVFFAGSQANGGDFNIAWQAYSL